MPKYKIHFKRGTSPESSIIVNLPEDYKTVEDVWNRASDIGLGNHPRYLANSTILKVECLDELESTK